VGGIAESEESEERRARGGRGVDEMEANKG